MDLENVHLAVDLETLEARTLFRYRPAHVTELAFADGRTELKEVRRWGFSFVSSFIVRCDCDQ